MDIVLDYNWVSLSFFSVTTIHIKTFGRSTFLTVAIIDTDSNSDVKHCINIKLFYSFLIHFYLTIDICENL